MPDGRAPDQLERRALIENDDQIDRLKRRHHFRARTSWSGLPSPFRRSTEASPLRPTMSRSHAARVHEVVKQQISDADWSPRE